MFDTLLQKAAQKVITAINNISLEELNKEPFEQEKDLLSKVISFADFNTLNADQKNKFTDLSKTNPSDLSFELPDPSVISGPIAIGVSLAILNRLAQKLKLTVEEIEQTPIEPSSEDQPIVYYQDQLDLTRIKQLVICITNKLLN